MAYKIDFKVKNVQSGQFFQNGKNRQNDQNSQNYQIG